MLVVVNVTKNSKRSFDVGSRLIRAEAGSDVVVVGTGSGLSYPLNERDRRSQNTYIELAEDQATVLAAMDAVYTQVSISLNVHPDNNPSNTVVATVDTSANIMWGEPYAPDTSKSYLYISEGAFKVKRILVAHTLAGIVLLA